MWRFLHFDLEICFAPQWRARFRHLNFQKWSVHVVFCTFWLGNLLRATTASTFSTSQLPTVVRRWCALYILTWKCASCHNSVQFLMSHLKTWLRTRRFSEPTIWPSGATNHWKNSESRLSYLFAHLQLLSSLSSSSLMSSHFLSSPLWLFPPLLFHLSILSEVWLLNFLRLLVDSQEPSKLFPRNPSSSQRAAFISDRETKALSNVSARLSLETSVAFKGHGSWSGDQRRYQGRYALFYMIYYFFFDTIIILQRSCCRTSLRFSGCIDVP